MKRVLNLLIVPVFFVLGCRQTTTLTPASVDRYSLLANTKYGPETDSWPATASDGWTPPEPLPFPVNTAGGEDSPFVTPDGNTLYFFFTPNVSIPAEKQLFDGVTGIWVVHRNGDTWGEPERVHLSNPSKLALDGCEFISGSLMYFCSAREGYTGIQWFRAELKNGLWQNWHYAGDELKQDEFEVGELHITTDGQELYFHSKHTSSYGGLDIWVSQKTPNGWDEPVNLGPQINTAADEGWPYISPSEQELWFTGQSTKGRPGPAIFRSLRQSDGRWGRAEEIISTFAGEPTLSANGRVLYFVHHYFSQDLSKMLEADIYVSYKIP